MEKLRKGWGRGVPLRSPEALRPLFPSYAELLIKQRRELCLLLRSEISWTVLFIHFRFSFFSFFRIGKSYLLFSSSLDKWIVAPPPSQWRHPVVVMTLLLLVKTFLRKGASSVGSVPTVSCFLHKPAVVGMCFAGQISSSLITSHNEVFVVLKRKEKRLRIVWEDDCAVPQVQRQEDYNG